LQGGATLSGRRFFCVVVLAANGPGKSLGVHILQGNRVAEQVAGSGGGFVIDAPRTPVGKESVGCERHYGVRSRGSVENRHRFKEASALRIASRTRGPGENRQRIFGKEGESLAVMRDRAGFRETANGGINFVLADRDISGSLTRVCYDRGIVADFKIYRRVALDDKGTIARRDCGSSARGSSGGSFRAGSGFGRGSGGSDAYRNQ
jgi:hypothetical protein